MKPVWKQLQARRTEVAQHPFFVWFNSETVPLEQRFVFAPLMIDFIMGFADMNKWFLSYENPENEHEHTINEHAAEDSTHSRLFYENWYTLELGAPADWAPGKMLWWLFHSSDGSTVRRFGMEILELATVNRDPLVRFALIEAIEVCGDVFFDNTAKVATRLSERDGVPHRYFGQYHRERETGHLQADESAFFRAELSAEQVERSLLAIDIVFDRFLQVLDRLRNYGERAVSSPRELEQELDREYEQELSDARGAGNVLSFRAPGRPSRVSESQRPVAEKLEGRLDRLRRHPLLAWLKASDSMCARDKLRGFSALWGIDIVGYKDFNQLVLRCKSPESELERALNRRTDELATHGALYLRDWAALDMDRVLGWDAGETIAFYFLGERTELHRHSMSRVKKLAFSHPDALSRSWLLHAIESAGKPLFEVTAEVARRAEREHDIRLDYWANRHELAHAPGKPSEPATSFTELDISAQQREPLFELLDVVFDNMEEQFSASLDAARGQLFVTAPASLPPPRISGFSPAGTAASLADELLVASGR